MNKVIDLSLAFLEKYMENNNIDLTDIDTFQYEVYPKMYAEHSSVGYNPSYNEFFCQWDGSSTWSEDSNQKAKTFIKKRIVELEEFESELLGDSRLTDKKMKDGKISYSDPDFKVGIMRELHVGYVNSVYSSRDIEPTVLEWLDMTIKKEHRDLSRVEERMKMARLEAIDKYSVRKNEKEEALHLFEKFKERNLKNALVGVVEKLREDQKKAYISTMIQIASDRVEGLEDKYWYSSIEAIKMSR